MFVYKIYKLSLIYIYIEIDQLVLRYLLYQIQKFFKKTIFKHLKWKKGLKNWWKVVECNSNFRILTGNYKIPFYMHIFQGEKKKKTYLSQVLE